MNFKFQILNRIEIKKTKAAFSLVEILIVIFIASVAFVAFYSVSVVGTKYIIEAKNRLAAVALVNEKMEIVRNMSYDDIGTVGGFVEGDIDPDEDIIANGHSYNVDTAVDYVDDSFDGLCEVICADPVPNDYKVVKITVSWIDSSEQTKEVSSLSRFVPQGLETAVTPPGAPWVVTVNENSGAFLVGVPQASVHIVNNDVSPAKNTTINTDNDGYILIPSAPESIGKYYISISKSGYETIETMNTTATFIPQYPHASITLGSLNTNSFVLNKLTSITIKTVDYQNNPVGGVDFSIAGGKLVGYESGAPVYYMSSIVGNEVYNQSNDSDETDAASGEKTYSDLSSGSYMIEMNPSTQNGYEFIDFDPSISPAVLVPGVNQTYNMRVAPSNVEALFIKITDSANNPVSGATAKLVDGSGTEIFSGKTSSARGIIFYPDGSSPLLAGNYTLEITSIGFETETKSITIMSGDITEENIQLITAT